MIYQTLAILLDHLRQDAGLAGYFSDHYPNRPVMHLIGLSPDLENGTMVPADHFPFISLTQENGKREGSQQRDQTLDVAITYGVFDDRLQEGVYLGFKAVLDLAELLLSALEQPLSAGGLTVTWDGNADFHSDGGMAEPYYQGEILLTVKVRQ